MVMVEEYADNDAILKIDARDYDTIDKALRENDFTEDGWYVRAFGIK